MKREATLDMIEAKEQLQQLLEKSRQLEQRIRQMAVVPLSILQQQEVQQELIGFSKQMLSVGGDLFLYDDSRYNPLLVVNQAIKESSRYSEEATLSLHHISQLKLVEFLFSVIEKEQQLNPLAYNILQLMQFGFARALLDQSEGLLTRTHPVRSYFELALKICKQCDDTSIPRIRDLLRQVRELLLKATASPESPLKSFSEASRQLVAIIHLHQEMINKRDEQLISKEVNQRKLYDVRHTVHDVISRATHSKKIPTFALLFLHEVWSKYLYITYLRSGVDSAQWREGISDMYQLIWSLVTKDGNELNRRMAGQLSESLRRIKKNTQSVHHNVEINHFFNTLATIHARIMEGKELEEVLFQGGEGIGAAAERDAAAEERPPPTPEVQAARLGGWFVLDYRGRNRRARLIRKSEEDGHLLFSDYSGTLVAKLSYQEYSEGVQQGSYRPLAMGAVFDSLWEQALPRLERYITSVDEQITTKERAIEQRKQQEAALARQRELARAKLEQQKREEQEALERQHKIETEEREREERIRQELELKQQLEEETRCQEEEAKREAERKVEEARQAEQQAFQKILDEVKRLEPGGMIELVDDHNETRICSLSLKLKRTGKLVFSDRTGRRTAEHLPQELATRIIEGNARIIDYGTTGDKRLDDLRWTRLTGE